MDAWIDQPAQLEDFLAKAPSRLLALDTEFIRERTFWPQLALLQVRRGETIALIDPLAFDRSPLIERVIRNQGPVVMHSPSEDLECLQHHFHVLPQSMFDSQRAAGLVGLDPAMSYQKLVAALLGVALEKGETRSDWMRRPLSDAQRQYAADDVRFLPELHDRLAERLEQLGRSHWQAEDCERLLQSAADASPDPCPHLSFRGAARFSEAAQRRLCRLLLWREAVARSSDRPRNWVLDSALITELAQHPPRDRRTFEQQLDATPKSPRRDRDRLWLLLSEPDDGTDMPILASEDSNHRARIRRLQEAVKSEGERIGVAESLLFPRRLIEAFARTAAWPDTGGTWRRELLAERLQSLL